MDIRALRFPSTYTNTAMDAIRDHLRGLADLDGNPVFARVEDGLSTLPGLQTRPGMEDVPACFIWQDSQRAETTQSDFLMTTVVTQVSLYIVFYDFAERTDSDRTIQKIRNEFIEYVISRLQPPDSQHSDSTGMVADGDDWAFATGQTVVVDHTSALKRVTQLYHVSYPWCVTRVDLSISSSGFSDTFQPVA